MKSKGIGVQMSIALLVVALAGSAAANEKKNVGKGPSNGATQCTDSWRDAPASEYCVGASVSTSTLKGRTRCTVSGSCSITVSVGGDDTTFSPDVSLTAANTGNTQDSDICFSSSQTAASGYTATVVAGGCTSTQTDSSTATADGLQAADPENTSSATSD